MFLFCLNQLEAVSVAVAKNFPDSHDFHSLFIFAAFYFIILKIFILNFYLFLAIFSAFYFIIF